MTTIRPILAFSGVMGRGEALMPGYLLIEILVQDSLVREWAP